jgi:F-type H+-transporting ATPase subunit gamma
VWVELIVTGEFDKIVIVYNSFVNAATQTVMSEEFYRLKPLAD